MRTLLLVVALVGCKSNTTDDLPIQPGGGTVGGGGGHPDAPADIATGDGSGLTGKVCLLTDPRNLVGCATAGAGGFTVTLGTASTTTADNGTFSLPAPSGTGLVWHVTGSGIMPSVRPFTTGDSLIPAMTVTMFDNVETDTGNLQLNNAGSIFVRVASGGAALSGATVASTPPAQYNTWYDGTTVSGWQSASTGAYGTALVGDVVVGTVTVSVTPAGGSATMIANVPVEDISLTFLSVTVP